MLDEPAQYGDGDKSSAKEVDEGEPHPVLQAFGRHLREHLLTPSGRSGDHRKARALSPFAGCYTYEPPPGVVWAGKKGLLPK
jgi:hypothetical protein